MLQYNLKKGHEPYGLETLRDQGPNYYVYTEYSIYRCELIQNITLNIIAYFKHLVLYNEY